MTSFLLIDADLFAGAMHEPMTPARLASYCSCANPDCIFRPGYLTSFRDHLARLHHVLVYADAADQLSDSREETWSAVTYHLQMAASIERVQADAGYVDLRGGSVYCEPAAGYDAEHSRLASDYASGLIIFNFVWSAYEAAIKAGAADFLPKQHTAFRGRKLMALNEATAAKLPGFARIAENASRRVFHVGDLERDRERVDRYPEGSAERAAELATILRNHLAHGNDEPPFPDQDHALCRTIRFYKAARLLLLLIQVVAIHALDEPDAKYADDWFDDELDCADRTTLELLANLHVESYLV